MCELIVALDYPHASQAKELIKKLGEEQVIYKIGLELFLAEGPKFVRELTNAGHRIFLDLKFHEIPNTVAAAYVQAASLGVDFTTLHLQGGSKMIQETLTRAQEITSKKPKILGVSVLTSIDEPSWNQIQKASSGQIQTVSKSVQGLVKLGVDAGLDAFVCSAHEVNQLKKAHPSAFFVVPGIRPAHSESNDQGRTMTPSEAKKAGADAIVVGRPITAHSEPVTVVRQILKDIL